MAGATITPSYLSSFTEKGERVSWIEQEPFEVVAECLANLGRPRFRCISAVFVVRTSLVVTGALNKLTMMAFRRLLPRQLATQAPRSHMRVVLELF